MKISKLTTSKHFLLAFIAPLRVTPRFSVRSNNTVPYSKAFSFSTLPFSLYLPLLVFMWVCECVSVYFALCAVFRSSRPDMFCKKGVLRNFAIFTGKQLCQRLFFNKVAGLRTPPVAASVFWRKWEHCQVTGYFLLLFLLTLFRILLIK